MTTIDDSVPPSAASAGVKPALADLASYPFLSALTDRRTRRIPRGFSVDAGPLSHESHNAPAPLSKLEEAILITCVTGITGITTHDGPLVEKNGLPELGTPFLNILARTGSSADNAQATYFFMINDDGIFLDDATFEDVRRALPMPVFPSYDFIDVLQDEGSLAGAGSAPA